MTMSTKLPSIRRQLITRLMTLLVLTVIMTFIATRQVAFSSLQQAQDQSLSAVAQVVADSLVMSDGRVDFTLPYPAFEVLAYQGPEALFYRVVGPASETLAGYADLPVLESNSETLVYRDVEVRVFQIEKRIRNDRPPVKVLIAQTQDELNKTVTSIASRAAFGLVGIFCLVAALVFAALQSGLRPLRHIERALSERQDDDFSSLEFDAPAEVTGLVNTLNRSLEKHRQLLDRSRAFIAEATHQIKTPIASLAAEADLLAQEAPAPVKSEIAQLAIHARQTSRLAEQLLTRAALRYREGLQHRKRQPIAPLLDSVAAGFEPLAEDKDVAITVISEPKNCVFDAVTLREALVCLLDNALKASPNLGDIQLHAATQPGRLEISVIDQGPGFAADLPPGTGLGLELVRGVAEAHGGSFTHSHREGRTCCTLYLPQ